MVGLFQYYGRYSMGLLYNQTRHLLSQPSSMEDQGAWNWWSLIGNYGNGNLHLGALPISTFSGKNDLKALEDLGIKAVLSMVDAFENRSEGYLTSPIKPEMISLNGIKHLQIPTPDCETIFFELLSRGVEFIHWNLKNGRSVLVHCKAGMVRSALTIICYLVKYQKLPGEEALALVKSKRRQAGFSKESSEWKTLKDFEDLLLRN
jgi:atypical dual specificity phosphatase